MSADSAPFGGPSLGHAMTLPTSSSSTASTTAPAAHHATPLNHLFIEWMSRCETEQFLSQTLQSMHQLDATAVQHQIVRDTTATQQAQLAHQTLAEQAQAVHMDDVNTHMPQSVPSSASGSGGPSSPQPGFARTLSPTLINITPPASPANASGGPSVSTSLAHAALVGPRSPLGPRSPSSSGRVLLSLSSQPHPLDPAHLQVDEVSLRASPTGAGRRITPQSIDLMSHAPSASPSPPGSPLASPNSMSRKRINKPLNLPSSPRLTSPSPPRSPARHIASPLPVARSPQSIRPFYYPDGVPASPTTKKREHELHTRLFNPDDETHPPGVGLSQRELFPITTLVCGFSSYCNGALFEKLMTLQRDLAARAAGQHVSAPTPAPEAALLDTPRVTLETFVHFHTREIERFDLPTRFFRLLRAQPCSTEPDHVHLPRSAAPSPLQLSATPTPHSSNGSAGLGPGSNSRRFLTRDDFKPIVQEIVNRHPGLEFLESTPEFQLKYAQTVIARIFYAVNKSGNECLTLRELKQSNFLLMLALLDQEDDINKLNDFFSYEHFYVIYCKFWELDDDHDGYLSGSDLVQYDEYALTNKVVDRLMSGAGRRLLSPIPGKMNYLDFVIFLISEVDKNNDVALDYFFNVIDIDADGVISTYEIEYFFEEQKQRIQSLSQELITFPDIMCQLIDMVQRPLLQLEANKKASHTATGELRLKEKKASYSSANGQLSFMAQQPQHVAAVVPSPTLAAPTFHSHHKPFHSTATHTPVQGGAVYNVSEGLFYKKDLRDSHMAGQFLNTLFNLNKFVLSEQRDPIRIKQIHDTPQLSDWDRYAISGYYRLAELPEAADSAAAWADMDGGPDDQSPYEQGGDQRMEVDDGQRAGPG